MIHAAQLLHDSRQYVEVVGFGVIGIGVFVAASASVTVTLGERLAKTRMVRQLYYVVFFLLSLFVMEAVVLAAVGLDDRGQHVVWSTVGIAAGWLSAVVVRGLFRRLAN